MALKLTLAPRAGSDIATIRDYLVARNPQAADRLRAAINATLTMLTDHARAGRDRPDLDARSIGIPHYSYTIYYRLEPGEIVVVHVRDDRRKPPAASDL